MTWSSDLLWPRVFWTLIGVGLALVAAIPFDRFDPRGAAVAKHTRRRPDRDPGDREIMLPVGSEPAASTAAHPAADHAVAVKALAEPIRAPRVTAMVAAELGLAIHSLPRAWIIVAVGLAAASWIVPMTVARAWVLPIAWIWPLLLWSAMGAREARYQTAPLLSCSPRPLAHHLPALWLAGVVVALVMGLGVGTRLALAGDFRGLLAWSVGAAFIPSLALAAGVWTRSSKLFEVLYLVIWYVGPMSRTPFLDFMGTTNAAAASGVPAAFAVATLVLMICALLGRRRALRS
jgi:hypothetical protein